MISAGKVAALYDIHGNLPALTAVLEDVRREAVDLIVIGGDAVPGPMPRETIDCLMALDLPVYCIHGNGEIAVLDEAAGREARVPDQVRKAIRWSAQQLDPDQLNTLRSWPKTLQLEIGEFGEILFCHATPRNENEIFTRLTPDDRVAAMFAGADGSVAVCGHTHMQFNRAVGDLRIVNAGSVGMPFGAAGAYWLLLGPEIEFRRTDYDLEAAAAQIRLTGYPEAEQFATNNVLNPPREEQMLQIMSSPAPKS